MKVVKKLILIWVVGVVLGVFGLKLYSYFNNPNKAYFVHTKENLKKSQKLQELLGENWGFGKFRLVQQLGANMYVTFEIDSLSKFDCIKAKIYEQNGVYKISETLVGIGGNPPAPKCFSASYKPLK